MPKNCFNVLIIEDCSIIATAYKNILDQIESISFHITFAKDCDEAFFSLQKSNPDLVLLDLQLPVSKNERLVTGEDIGRLIRSKFSTTKIIILTSIYYHQKILSIIKEISPEGFMIKSDIDNLFFKNAIVDVLNGKKCYSVSVNKYFNKFVINGKTIDDYDRQILYHLSMGEKTKDLRNYIPLSTRAIEERKVKLKTLLDDGTSSNFNLVRTAKKEGLI